MEGSDEPRPRDVQETLPSVPPRSALVETHDTDSAVGRKVASAWRRTTARLHGEAAVDGRGLKAEPGPRRVGRYELRDALGGGGCGTVYRAWDPKHEREVALKVVHKADAAARARFEREIKATARLRHPGVVPLLDSGEHDGQLFIVTELIAGGSLDKRIEEGPLPAEAAARIVRDVAEAIHFAHGQGVLHRDLKPHNVLLEPDGRARVVDFGLARMEDKARLTESGVAVGTPAYMPPEQVEAKPLELSAASDVYSLGATLYDALTGRPPFDVESVEEMFLAVLRADPEAPSTHRPGLPADLDTICLKCLDKDPARRYATAAELAADLDRVLRGEPVVARRAGALTQAWRWSRRNPLLAVMSALLVVLSLALVAVVAKYVDLARQVQRGR